MHVMFISVFLLFIHTHTHTHTHTRASQVMLGVKELACQCRRCERHRHRFSPWVRKILWRRAWQPTPEFLPGESHGQRSLVGYSPLGFHRVGHELSALACMHMCVYIYIYLQYYFPLIHGIQLTPGINFQLFLHSRQHRSWSKCSANVKCMGE